MNTPSEGKWTVEEDLRALKVALRVLMDACPPNEPLKDKAYRLFRESGSPGRSKRSFVDRVGFKCAKGRPSAGISGPSHSSKTGHASESGKSHKKAKSGAEVSVVDRDAEEEEDVKPDVARQTSKTSDRSTLRGTGDDPIAINSSDSEIDEAVVTTSTQTTPRKRNKLADRSWSEDEALFEQLLAQSRPS